ncbi:hypothetical protein CPAV1605_661 [seawater metagenome]|uniref:Uncharacterized protein n=1 Tax=seawater metagenome TaxID=1561972 RepID=A0A5E8CIM6_9ZZZZ
MHKNNYYPFSTTTKPKEIQGHNKEKIKYFNNNTRNFNKPDCKCGPNDDPIDVESFLRNSSSQSRSKTSIELSQKFSPKTFDINYKDNRNQKFEQQFNRKNMVQPRYLNDKPYTGPGRGIGNLDISDNTRVGMDTRRYNEEYRNISEAEILDRFHFIDNSIQDPNHIVLPFPQGGIQTRDNKKLINKCNQKFKFSY